MHFAQWLLVRRPPVQAVAKGLDHMGLQLRQCVFPEGGADMCVDLGPVLLHRGPFFVKGVFRQPYIQPFGQRHFAGLDIGPIVYIRNDR